MKFAMIIDIVGGGMESYYVKDNKGYKLNGEPFGKVRVINYTHIKSFLKINLI